MSTPMQITFDTKPFAELLIEWRDDVVINAVEAHYDAQRFFTRRHRRLGGAAVVFSTVAGASAFQSLASSSVVAPSIVLGASALAAVFAALQTFLGDSDRANKHRLTGSGYASVRRLIAQSLRLPPLTGSDADTRASRIRRKMDKLSRGAPELPAGLLGGFMREHAPGEVE